MVHLLRNFVACCRAAGLRISTAEVLDCATMLKLVDPLHQGHFKAVIKASLIKSRRDQPQFERLYQLFFHGAVQVPSSAESSPKDDIRKVIEDLSPDGQGPVQQAVYQFIQGNPLPLLQQLQQVQQPAASGPVKLKSNLGPLTARLSIMLALNQLKSRIPKALSDALPEDALEERRDIDNLLTSRINTAHAMLAENPRPQNFSLKEADETARQTGHLGAKSFANLSAREVSEMRVVIARLVRKLKDVVSRRMAKRSRGVLDIKTTLRKAARFQGLPLELTFKQRPPRKPRIVVLCDISGSVWSTARFMLSLLYALSDCFAQVKSFVFVAGIADVSDILAQNEINRAVEKVLSGDLVDLNTLTDYGETFRQVKAHHLSVLNQKTTLIIVGDGRTNYLHPEDAILSEMRHKCRRLIWLNPEPRRFWDTGDSAMTTYMAFCHEARVCRNLNQLADFIESLLL